MMDINSLRSSKKATEVGSSDSPCSSVDDRGSSRSEGDDMDFDPIKEENED